MRLVVVSTYVLAANFALIACSGDSGQAPQQKGGATSTTTQPQSQTGGSGQSTQPNQSGGASTGGTTNDQKGGAATGGSSPTGGTSTATSAGGKANTGGTSTATSAGGASAGGKTNAGGTSAATSMGGKTSTGGTSSSSSIATGGVRPTGGTTATGGTSSTPTGGTTASSTAGPTVQRLSSGTDGWASRYWDCCKPSCGWSGNTGGKTPVPSCDKNNQRIGDYNAKNACESGGTAFECWDFAPWSVSDTLSYGFVAFNGQPCGTCLQVDFKGTASKGNAASAGPLSNKSMIVQVINIGGLEGNQLDILIPGGGVGAMNACSNQWGVGNDQLGAQYGGFLTGCNGDKSCVANKCSTIFGSRPGLKAGCDWFLGWYNGADNPDIKFAKVACPQAITAKSGMSG